MPIALRRFYTEKLIEQKKEEHKTTSKSQRAHAPTYKKKK